MAVVASLVAIQQVRTIKALRASIAFMRASILMTFQVTVEMVSAFIGSPAEMTAMRAVRMRGYSDLWSVRKVRRYLRDSEGFALHRLRSRRRKIDRVAEDIHPTEVRERGVVWKIGRRGKEGGGGGPAGVIRRPPGPWRFSREGPKHLCSDTNGKMPM